MQTIIPGLGYTWICNDEVLTYEVSSLSNLIMMEWSNHILDVLANWPVYKPVQILFNLSRPKVSIPYLLMTNHDLFNIGITQFGKAKAQQILVERGDSLDKLALLIPATSSGAVLRMHSQESNPMINGHLFYSYSKAIEWLTETKAVAKVLSQMRTFNMSLDAFQQIVTQAEVAPLRSKSQKSGLFYNFHNLIIEMPIDEPLVIGRQNFDYNVVGEEAFAISRLHAQIDSIDHDLYITDLTSTNGTFVNGKKLEAQTRVNLEIGDEIRLGYTLLRLDYIND